MKLNKNYNFKEARTIKQNIKKKKRKENENKIN